MAVITVKPGGVIDMEKANLPALLNLPATIMTPTRYVLQSGLTHAEFYGANLIYENGQLTGGTITQYQTFLGGLLLVDMSELNLSAATFMAYLRAGDRHGAIAYLTSGVDTMTGGADDDDFYGGAGNDVINGASGLDNAVYDKPFSNYVVSHVADGVWTVADKAGSEGVDTLNSVELLTFSDQGINLVVHDRAMDIAGQNILRVSLPTEISSLVGSYWWTAAKGVAEMVKRADETTSVATMSYQFFTGKIPSEAGVDYLVSAKGPNPNNLNGAYYQSFNLENRYINFAVNLGKDGEGKATFAAKYGSLSLFEAAREAYRTIFGGTPTDAKVHALIDTRVDYFASYGGDGAAGIGTKAAMVGWLLAEAAKADVGMYSKANDAFLTDLADGATFAIDLVGVYGKTSFNYAG